MDEAGALAVMDRVFGAHVGPMSDFAAIATAADVIRRAVEKSLQPNRETRRKTEPTKRAPRRTGAKKPA